jgi:hypothetical protein
MSTSESNTAMDSLRSVADLAVIAAVVWIVVLRHILAVPTDVEDVLSSVANLAFGGWALLQAIQAPDRTRRVRDGWIGRTLLVGFRTFKGTRAEFVARFRFGITLWGVVCLIGGVFLTGLDVMLLAFPGTRQEPELVYPLSTWTGVFFGLTLLIVGVVLLKCRHILASPRQGSAPAPDSR